MQALNHIRPHRVLSIEDKMEEKIVFFMPPAAGAGALTVFESVMLLKLVRCTNPDFIFEFGTFDGRTTRLILENLPENGSSEPRIYTLDLPGTEGVVFQGDDKLLAEKALLSERKYLSSKNKHLVKQVFQDSMTLNAEPYLKKFDFIFIDANHEYEYVKKDTENSRQMISEKNGCIVWHDYGNPQFPELTRYLDELGKSLLLYHIEGTMLVFHFTENKIQAI